MENTENYHMESTDNYHIMKPMSLWQILKHLSLYGMRTDSIIAALSSMRIPRDAPQDWLVSYNSKDLREYRNVLNDADQPFFDDDDGAKKNLACLVALTRAIIFDSETLRRKANRASSPPPIAPPLPKSEAELRTLGFSDWEIEDYFTTLEKLEPNW